MANGIGQVTRMRVLLALAGGGGGLCFYLLADVIDRTVIDPRLHLFLAVFAGTFFGALLAMAGPLRVGRAAVSALALALAVGALAWWASFRFDDPAQLLHAPESVLAAFLIATLPLPYLIAAALPETGWRDYPTLFSQSWGIVVRYASAWLFVGVLWLLLLLSDSLFRLVGLNIIHDLLEIDAVPYVLTGLGLGLALAVVNELSDYVSPFLVLRLLRLLLLPVAIVVAVFLVALPLRGLSGLFGQFSPATTLLAMAVATATLVSTALDQNDAEAVESPLMVLSVQLLALMLPVMAALAGYAMWLRIAQYGLTPARIAGANGAGLLLAYGLLYAAAVLMRGAWMERVRQGNSLMALVVIVLAAMWLTPVFDAGAISASNQVARFKAGRVPVGALDLVTLQARFGRAGAAALAELRALSTAEGQGALRERLADFDAGVLPGGLDLGPADAEHLRRRLVAVLPLRPEAGAGADALRDAVLAAADPGELRAWVTACNRALPDGRPGCVMVHGDFMPDRPGEEALLLYRDPAGFLRSEAFAANVTGSGLVRPETSEISRLGIGNEAAAATLARVLDGRFTIGPAALNALRLEERQLLMLP